MPQKKNEMFEFGPFRFDPLKRILIQGDRAIAVPGKALDILKVLVERVGQPVSKEDLLDAVWPGIAVEENNLTVHISSLRKAFGETPGDHRYIVTLPGRGYQFVAQVRVADSPPQTAEEPRRLTKWIFLAGALTVLIAGLALLVRSRSPSPAASADPRTLAIMPFKLR